MQIICILKVNIIDCVAPLPTPQTYFFIQKDIMLLFLFLHGFVNFLYSAVVT